MYQPTNWPKLAEDLAETRTFLDHVALLNSTGTKRSLLPSLLDFERRQTNDTSDDDDPAPDYTFQGVTCADAVDAGNVTTKDVFDFLVNVTRTVSQMCKCIYLGPDRWLIGAAVGPSWGDAGLYCHRWPVRAVERFTGPWNSKLSNPILVIGVYVVSWLVQPLICYIR
jgi:hypothetical protein